MPLDLGLDLDRDGLRQAQTHTISLHNLWFKFWNLAISGISVFRI